MSPANLKWWFTRQKMTPLKFFFGLVGYSLALLVSFEIWTTEPNPPFIILLGAGILALFGFLFWSYVLVGGAYCIATSFHELGHIVAGRLAGFEFASFDVLGVRLQRRQLGLGLRLRSFRVGAVGQVNVSEDPRLAEKWRIYLLGGPVASFIYFGIAVWLYWSFTSPENSIPHHLINIVLAVNVAIVMQVAFLPVSPITNSDVLTDFAYLRLLKSPAKDHFIAFMRLNQESRSGIWSDNWSKSLLDILGTTPAGSPLEPMARTYRYFHFLKTGDHETAWEEVSIAAGAAKSRALAYQVTLYEEIFAAYWFGRAAEEIPPWPPERRNITVLVKEAKFRAEAAMKLSEHQYEDAARLANLSKEADREIYSQFGFDHEAWDFRITDEIAERAREGISDVGG